MKKIDHSSAVREFDRALLIDKVIKTAENDIYERELKALRELLDLLPDKDLRYYTLWRKLNG